VAPRSRRDSPGSTDTRCMVAIQSSVKRSARYKPNCAIQHSRVLTNSRKDWRRTSSDREGETVSHTTTVAGSCASYAVAIGGEPDRGSSGPGTRLRTRWFPCRQLLPGGGIPGHLKAPQVV